MSRRRRRPRKAETEGEAPAPAPDSGPLVGRTELIAAAFLFLGAAAILGIILLIGGGGDDNGGSVQASITPGLGQPLASGAPASLSATDEEFIAELARQSIETLPAGEWPSLYDDFTTAYQARCSIEEFTAAGEDGARAVGADLPLLGFVRLEELTSSGGLVRAVVVGEIKGKSEYRTEEYFMLEGGAWKIAPAPGSEGCSAFNQLQG